MWMGFAINFKKLDPYHDEEGKFTSAGGASGGGGQALEARDFVKLSDEDAYEQTKLIGSELGLNELNPAERAAVGFYTTTRGSKEINSALRAGTSLGEEAKEHYNEILNVLQKSKGLEKPLVTYRGLALSPGDDPLKVLARIEDGKSFTSTSLTGNQPSYFMSKYGDDTSKYIIRVESPAGTKGLAIYKAGEAEFTLPPGSKIKWTAVRDPTPEEAYWAPTQKDLRW